MRWEAQRRVFRALSEGDGHFALDLTRAFSESESIPWLEKGCNPAEGWPDQFQLLLIHRLGRGPHPVFLKMLPGSPRDVSTRKNAPLESGLENVLLTGGKSLFSEGDMAILEKHWLTYLLTLRRNLAFLHYGSESSCRDPSGYRDRLIWRRSFLRGRRRVFVFLDKALRAQEETAFWNRIEQRAATRASFEQHWHRLGTLALATNTDF